jgi:UDP-N-acetylglucosamine 2-epimerase
MKLVHIVGARPQFIKMAVVSRAWRKCGEEVILHTGQHYDVRMSQQFFDELSIPAPNINLEVGSGSHAQQTAAMLLGIESELGNIKPDAVLVYGDTNTTLAGALATAKMNVPLGHVEAGLRSFNRQMPEEINRVVTDHLANLLFCPTQQAIDNLQHEGIDTGAYLVGDVMADALFHYQSLAEKKSTIFKELAVSPRSYILLTLHRSGNVDDKDRLNGIIYAMKHIDKLIVFPMHPRTQKMLSQFQIELPANVRAIKPVGYLDMLNLQANAQLILTDSGGIQKEAYLQAVPCITLREETEWVETVEAGWNCLAGTSSATIIEKVRNFTTPQERPALYGDGNAAEKITDILVNLQTTTKED